MSTSGLDSPFMTQRLTKTSKSKQKLVFLNARVPVELRDRAKLYADRTGRKLQHVVACAIEEYISRIGNPAH